MADGVTHTSTGKNIATDEVTRNAVTEHQQIVKISLGTENASDLLLDSGQQNSANSLPVVISSDQSTLPVDVTSSVLPTGAATSANQTTLIGHVDGIEGLLGTIDADTGSILTSIQLLDDTVATDGSAAVTKLIQIGGTDGTNAQILSVTSSGHLNIADGGNTITVDGTIAATQSGTWNITNISGTISLPTGASTSANQTTIIGHLDGVEGALTDLDTKVLAISDTLDTIAATVSGGEIQVDVLSSALPTGASTSAKQDTIIGHVDGIEALLGTIDADTSGILTAIQIIDNAISGNEMQVDVLTMPSVTVTSTNLDIRDLTSASDSVAAVQSGTWNVTNISGTVSLPTGASTSANQTTIIGHLDGVEGLLGTIDADTGSIMTSVQLLDDVVITDDAAFTPGTTKVLMIGAQLDNTGTDSVDEGDAGALRMSANRNLFSQIRDAAGNERGANVNASNQLSVSVDNTVTVASHAVTNAGTFAVQAAQSGTWNITNVSGTVSLPTGASTSANQTTLIGHVDGIETVLGTIDADTGSLVSSVSNISGAIREAGQEITVGLGLLGDNAGEAVILTSNASGHLNIADGGGSLTIDGSITNISGTISLPTGASTSANQTTIIGHLDGVEGLLGTIDADTGSIMTAVQLLDNVVATDGSAAVTALFQVGGTDGTNAQILSTNSSGHLNIADGGNTITVDGTIAATQSGTWNVTNVSGTISLPTGAATEATLDDALTELQDINGYTSVSAAAVLGDGNALSFGVAIMGSNGGTGKAVAVNASGHVLIADGSNSITVDNGGTFAVQAAQSGTWNVTNVSGTISLPTGASTSANQTTIIGHLDGVEGLLTTIDADTSILSNAIRPVSNASGLNGIMSGIVGWALRVDDFAEAASTASVINATAHGARVGDIIQIYGDGDTDNRGTWSYVSAVAANTITVSPAFPDVISDGTSFGVYRAAPLRASYPNDEYAAGTLIVSLEQTFTTTAATRSPIKSEDSAFGNGHALMMAGAVNNRSASVFNSTNGDATPISVTDEGAIFANIDVAFQGRGTAGNSPVRREDQAFGDQETVMVSGAVINTGMGEFSATDGDIVPISSGRLGNIFSTLIYDPTINPLYTPIGLEDSTFNSGDAVMKIGVKQNAALTTQSSSADDVVAIAASAIGGLITHLVYDSSITASSSAIRLEDQAFAGGSAMVMAGAVNNTSMSAHNATSGDCTPIAVGRAGNVLSTIVYDPNVASTSTAVLMEDEAFAANGPCVMVGNVRQDTISSLNGTDGDVTPFKSDSVGALYVTTRRSLTGSSPTAASVGTSSAAAVSSNANRKGLVLTNTSNNTISLAFAAAAVLNSGITLFPGDSFSMDEYNFTTAEVRAIASVAASNLAIQEFA